MLATDPLPLAQALIRCASITPVDDGAQGILTDTLEQLGFEVHRLRFGMVENFFARIGTERPHLCFAGHTDVVPAGEGWGVGPFAGEVRDGLLFGRGAVDMKGAVAAFVAAAADRLTLGPAPGSISLLITGDEEGPATDGTVQVVDWMRRHDQVPDFCLVGEPTNPERLGEVIKVGRRGSLNAKLRVFGRQGHVAYPQRADNPVHRLLRALSALTAAPLDAGTAWFEPSSLQVSSVDVDNPASNVIPGVATAALNIRFNDRHDGAGLERWLRACLAEHAEQFELAVSVSGEAFLTEPGGGVALLAEAVARATGLRPRLETGGGTSDARFIAGLCPVAEFGLVGTTMHAVDERVPVEELRQLAVIYRDVIGAFLA